MSAVLVFNTGSSSVKYQLLELDGRGHHDGDGPAGGSAGHPDDGAVRVLASGILDEIGGASSRLVHRAAGAGELVVDEPAPDHEAAFGTVFAALDRTGLPAGLAAIGHRVVHGGEEFSGPALVDDAMLATLRALSPLAPLHNPVGVRGIELARRRFPDLPHVAVFDTAFHHGMPARARRYALPRDVAERHGIRRYGFHGISHAYVARRAAAHLGRPPAELALVTLHLGNGASATAVAGGRSVDTSMGLTPLAGLVMGTRSGDVDPGVVFHLHREAGMAPAEIEELLTRRSGLTGLAGASDMREVHRRIAAGDADAAEAFEVFCYRIRCYVGAYAAALGRLDAIVFTAGIGENDAAVRARVCAGLEGFGVRVDPERNAGPAGPRAGQPRTVSADGSRVAVLVVPTDEEREIARQALEVVNGRAARVTAASAPPSGPPRARPEA